MCNSNQCRKCNGTAKLSKGFGNTYISHSDFGNDAGTRGTTQTRTTGQIEYCLKCSDCGHSWIPEDFHDIKVGDYVRTSKGKIGQIIRQSRFEIGYYNNVGDFRVLENMTLSRNDDSIEDIIENRQWSYPNQTIESRLVKPLVKLGSREYVINLNQLTKLHELTIRTQQGLSQFTIKLPIEDAKLLIDIYQRNDIWFNVE